MKTIAKLKKKYGKVKLNLGCGRDIKKDHFNIDTVNLEGVDLIYDLNDYPYPFKDNSIDEIRAVGMIEHIIDIIKFMEELHRICKKNAKVIITAPHYRSVTAYCDPTHKHFFTPDSFDYFTDSYIYNFYTKVRFEIVEKKMIPTKIGRFVPNKLLNFFGFFVGGFIQAMYFEMKVVK